MCKKHEWKLLNQFETKSEFELVRDHGYRPENYHKLKKKYITDYACIHCGKLKRFEESN